MTKDLWLFHDRITLSVGYHPQWDLSGMKWIDAYYNDWRLGDRCLDMALRIGRVNFNCVCWKMPFAKNRYYSDDYDG